LDLSEAGTHKTRDGVVFTYLEKNPDRSMVESVPVMENDEGFKCVKCASVLSSLCSRKQHFRSCILEASFKCGWEGCDVSCTRVDGIRGHWFRMHVPTQWVGPCKHEGCNRMFLDSSVKTKHEKMWCSFRNKKE
jgi:hypothetical protein